jgi:SAM-dependent methyltransferase
LVEQRAVDEGTQRALRSLATRIERLAETQRQLRETMNSMANDVLGEARLLAHQTRLGLPDLAPSPYVADPALLKVHDDHGHETIGYRDYDSSVSERTYRAFEDIFRGSEKFIRDRQRFYVPLLESHAPVLDVGCGRGELLELLRDATIDARGVDIDPGMVTRCLEKGLDVKPGNLNEHLARMDDDSLGAVFSAQVIEHLGYEELLSFLEMAYRVLRPGGVFIAETVNPHSFPAFKMFWIDPTHRAPLFPEVVVALCRIQGFESALTVFPNGSGDLEADRRSQGEYAVVARKREIQR